MTAPADDWQRVFFRRFEAALPVDDLMAWILREFPTATETQVLTMVQAVCNRDQQYLIEVGVIEERRYRVDGDTWNAYPQRVSWRDTPPQV